MLENIPPLDQVKSTKCLTLNLKYPPTGSGKVDEMPDPELFEVIFGDSDLIEGLGKDVSGFDCGEPAASPQGKAKT